MYCFLKSLKDDSRSVLDLSCHQTAFVFLPAIPSYRQSLYFKHEESTMVCPYNHPPQSDSSSLASPSQGTNASRRVYMPHTHTVKFFSITCVAYQKHPSPHSTESYPQQECLSHSPAHVCTSRKTLVTFLLPSDFLLKNLSLSVSIQSSLSLWCLTGSIFTLS